MKFGLYREVVNAKHVTNSVRIEGAERPISSDQWLMPTHSSPRLYFQTFYICL